MAGSEQGLVAQFATEIVARSRLLPTEQIGMALVCDTTRIERVKVTGGFGWRVCVNGKPDAALTFGRWYTAEAVRIFFRTAQHERAKLNKELIEDENNFFVSTKQGLTVERLHRFASAKEVNAHLATIVKFLNAFPVAIVVVAVTVSQPNQAMARRTRKKKAIARRTRTRRTQCESTLTSARPVATSTSSTDPPFTLRVRIGGRRGGLELAAQHSHIAPRTPPIPPHWSHHSPCAMSPAVCRRLRGTQSCAVGGQSHRSITGVRVSPVSEGGLKLRCF